MNLRRTWWYLATVACSSAVAQPVDLETVLHRARRELLQRDYAPEESERDYGPEELAFSYYPSNLDAKRREYFVAFVHGSGGDRAILRIPKGAPLLQQIAVAEQKAARPITEEGLLAEIRIEQFELTASSCPGMKAAFDGFRSAASAQFMEPSEVFYDSDVVLVEGYKDAASFQITATEGALHEWAERTFSLLSGCIANGG